MKNLFVIFNTYFRKIVLENEQDKLYFIFSKFNVINLRKCGMGSKTMFPQRGKKLFQSTDNYFDFAYIGWGRVDTQFYGYVKGYKHSADTLVDFAVDSEDIKILDTYIFPILFLYRQFIELSIKSLYIEYSNDGTMDEKVQKSKNIGHKLEGIWKLLKPTLINASDSQSEKEDIEIVENYIMQYHHYDQTSFKFNGELSR